MVDDALSEPTAVVLAAGNGLRLKTRSHGVPKPLRRVRGVPLLEWVLGAFRSRGVRRFVVVLGYRAEEIRQHLEGHLGSELVIDYVVNPRFDLGNGVSALAARPTVSGRFFLSMGDHIFAPSMVDELLACPLSAGEMAVATDAKLDRIFDLAEAMKVRLEGHRVLRVGKQLDPFDVVDTGLFLANEGLFDALERSAAAGRHALADGINLLADEGRVRATDVGPARWIDVDTPEDLAQAERMLDPSSGVLSLERPSDTFASPLGR